MTQSLIDLFTAALETESTVIVHERRSPGARGTLYAWASVMNVEVTSIALAGGRMVAHRVSRGACDIQVVSRADATSVEVSA